MKKVLFNFLLMVFAWNAHAHQADVSTTLLSQQAGDNWILQVKGALTAFEYEVATNFPDEVYQSPEEFQELVIRHLMENISIVFNEKIEIKLERAFVKLGHETNVIFEVIGVPENFSTVYFKNSSFKDIHKNQSALVILKEGLTQKQFVLNNENQHTVQLTIKDMQLVPLIPNHKKSITLPITFTAIIVSGAIAVFMFLKLRKRKTEAFYYQ